MQGEESTPEGLPSDAPPPGSDHDVASPTPALPGAGLVRLPMLTVDSEPASLDLDADVGRIPNPQGRPVVVELPTDPAALTAKALEALADIADDLNGSGPILEAGQKKAGHDGPAKSNREVKTTSAKHYRLREPR